MNLAPRTSAEDLLFVLWKWKLSVLSIVCLTMLFIGFWLFFVNEDYYTVEAKLLIKPGQEQSAPATVLDRQQATVGYRSADVKSEVDVLQSTDLINVLIDKYKLDQPQKQPPPKGFLKTVKFRVKSTVNAIRDTVEDLYIAAGLRERLTPREKALEALRRGLSVKAVEGSNSIIADLSMPFRSGSGAVLNALIDEYMKFRVAIYRNRGDEYFRTAMDQRSADLTKAESAKNGFERGEDITSEQQEKNLLLQQLSDLDEARHQAEVEYKVAQAKFEQLGREGGKDRPNFGALGDFDSSPFQRTLLSEIAILEKHREELLLTEMDGSGKVKNMDDQIRILSDMLKANVESVRDERRARLDAATAEEAKIKARLGEIHGSEVRWMDLQRKTRSLEDEYDLFRKKYNESAAARTALEQQVDENVAVLEHATDPLQPSGMRKTMALGLAFAAALIAAFAYVTVGEYFDHRVYTPTEMERNTGAPVLAIVPFQANRVEGARRFAGIEGRS